ncbi:MAG TPA: hypothetical protein VFI27_00420 [candidate division Zixibacteria bacterium]|nr:hypothetical protein [candidate division Zixibacteria bacterium]
MRNVAPEIMTIVMLTPITDNLTSLIRRGESLIHFSHGDRVVEIADRDLWFEDVDFMNMVQIGNYLGLGMSIDKENAPAHEANSGRDFYFWANGCRDVFLSEPTQLWSE